jgi:hypothetical protein
MSAGLRAAPEVPVSLNMVDTLLRENTLLEAAIVENLQHMRLREVVVYMERLQRNLLALTRLRELQAATAGTPAFPPRPARMIPSRQEDREAFGMSCLVAGLVAHETMDLRPSPYADSATAAAGADEGSGAADAGDEEREDDGEEDSRRVRSERGRVRWTRGEQERLLQALRRGVRDTAELAREAFGVSDDGVSKDDFEVTPELRKRVRDKLKRIKPSAFAAEDG